MSELKLDRHMKTAIQDIWGYQNRGRTFSRCWRMQSVKKLVEAGLATYEPFRPFDHVLLTEAGIEIARELG